MPGNEAFSERFPWARTNSPLAIAHRGASAHAHDNSLRAFDVAAQLGADFWEVDVRLTADRVCICHHDAVLTVSGRSLDIAGSTLVELSPEARQSGPNGTGRDSETTVPVPFQSVLHLARQHDCGIYADIKDEAAADSVIKLLRQTGVDMAVLALSEPAAVARLSRAGCPFALAVMVPAHQDPFPLAEQSGADIVHLCWEHATAAPQELVTESLLKEAHDRHLGVVLWHEERQSILDHLLELPVLGICSNTPERLKPYRPGADCSIEILAHRGAMTIAPENTMAAFECAFAQGCTYVEFDIRTSSDGCHVILHDATVDRTSDGHGDVNRFPMSELQKLDFGNWFDSHHAGTRIPTLDQLLEFTSTMNGKLFVEIKDAPVSDILAAIDRHHLMDDVFFWSFDDRTLREIRRHQPAARLMSRRKDYPNLEDAISTFDAWIVEFDADKVTGHDIQHCRESGVRSMIAYTGKDEEMMKNLLHWQPSVVNLDYPQVFIRFYREFVTGLG